MKIVMIRSADRLPITHVGSLYRSPKLLESYYQFLSNKPYEEGAFREQVRIETREAVRYQAELGIDIPPDGESR
jgi:methionine synthase II (cobalamin-independent)